MMGLTLAELQAELRVHLGKRSSEDSRLVNVLNLAQIRLARAETWEELNSILPRSVFSQSTNIAYNAVKSFYFTDGQKVKDILNFNITDGGTTRKKLVQIKSHQFYSKYPDLSLATPGIPHTYHILESSKDTLKVEVYPPPNAAYTLKLKVSKWPKAFETGKESETSQLTFKDDLIIMLAMSYLMRSLQKNDSAKEFFGVYSGMLKEAKKENSASIDLDILPESERIESSPSNYWADPFYRG